jgi:predicted alpha-1,2-mannosidase
MCGSPLTTVVSQAWQYGLQHFDIVPAYDAMLKDATEAPPAGALYGEADIDDMNTAGYIPDDHCSYGSVSQTEEDCIAYAALAPLADSLGRLSDSQMLQKRAMNYKNVFNPGTGFMQPRLGDGTWRTPFDPAQSEGYVEGSGWQYLWLVPHDVRGLITLIGGDTSFNAKLDTFFAYPKPEWTGAFYNPYNEPDLQAPFLYDWSGAPAKSQAQVRKILGEVYHAGPDGIPGNDDCGTMSAWAVFAMMGLYPADATQPNFELCSPVFSKVILHLTAPHGIKTFVVDAPGTSDTAKYIQSATLNGDPLAKCWVTQDAISSGGALELTMAPAPSRTWAVGQAARPPSLSDPDTGQ